MYFVPIVVTKQQLETKVKGQSCEAHPCRYFHEKVTTSGFRVTLAAWRPRRCAAFVSTWGCWIRQAKWLRGRWRACHSLPDSSSSGAQAWLPTIAMVIGAGAGGWVCAEHCLLHAVNEIRDQTGHSYAMQHRERQEVSGSLSSCNGEVLTLCVQAQGTIVSFACEFRITHLIVTSYLVCQGQVSGNP